jgi:AraC family transcriptional regulator, regulatory protein of adaptative response / DNA-3-methyladenine glycosylase II
VRRDEAECYGAIAANDDRFDGLFFSGIVTTGVYCRPVCPVPRPAKRENVRFFASAPAAEGAGFRPCRRCHPERAASIGVWSGVPPVVSHALNLIAGGALDGDGGVDRLAERVGIGSRQLRRLFDEHLGASPLALAKARRVNFARRLLDDTDLPIARVALAAGFRSVRQFNHDVRRTFGRPPSELRRKGGKAGAGGDQVAIRLPYRPPLDWASMVAFLQARATRGVEVVEHDRYRRTVRVDDAPAVIELRVVPDQPHVVLTLRATTEPRLVDVAERAQRIFDLGADPVAIAAHLGHSADLADRVRSRPGIRVPGAWDAFELAVRAILGQQISVRAASTLAARLAAVHGEPFEAGDGLTHLFPTASALAHADLMGIGATRSQARSIRALAAAVAAGELAIEAPRGLDEFVERMCQLPGVGPWTAHYVAMRACGEPDAFPAGDLGLRRAAGNGRPLSERALSDRAEPWRPWRSYAAMYLWSRESVAKRTDAARGPGRAQRRAGR